MMMSMKYILAHKNKCQTWTMLTILAGCNSLCHTYTYLNCTGCEYSLRKRLSISRCIESCWFFTSSVSSSLTSGNSGSVMLKRRISRSNSSYRGSNIKLEKIWVQITKLDILKSVGLEESCKKNKKKKTTGKKINEYEWTVHTGINTQHRVTHCTYHGCTETSICGEEGAYKHRICIHVIG